MLKTKTTDVLVFTDTLLFNGGTSSCTSLNTINTLTTGISPTLTGYSGTGTLNNISGGTGHINTNLLHYPQTGTAPYQMPAQTYNDFWRFDEEFDILWKSFFEHNAMFKPIKEKAVSHPCDIQETDNGLKIEIAAVGLDKNEIELIVDSETLRVAYRKSEDEKTQEKNEYRYFHRSIKKASFDIAWKISSKYELTNLEATLEKGLLTIDIPFAKENKPKKMLIK
jgi:HSP20 family protein